MEPSETADFAKLMQERITEVTRAHPLPKGVQPTYWHMLLMMAAQPVQSLARVCLELGAVWGPDVLTQTEKHGAARQCFKNAGQWAIHDRAFTYVEGFACTQELGFAVHHAWLVDGEGRVVDPTWRNGHSYCGLPFKQEVLMRVTLETGVWGLFGSLALPDWVADDIGACLAQVPPTAPAGTTTAVAGKAAIAPAAQA